MLLLAAPSASAETICKVTDPTGTPLNVNGRKINVLKNGREVEIIGSGRDKRGRPWVQAAGDYQGQPRIWGWVLREFISCYER